MTARTEINPKSLSALRAAVAKDDEARRAKGAPPWKSLKMTAAELRAAASQAELADHANGIKPVKVTLDDLLEAYAKFGDAPLPPGWGAATLWAIADIADRSEALEHENEALKRRIADAKRRIAAGKLRMLESAELDGDDDSQSAPITHAEIHIGASLGTYCAHFFNEADGEWISPDFPSHEHVLAHVTDVLVKFGLSGKIPVIGISGERQTLLIN